MPANLRMLRSQIREIHLAIHAIRQNPKIAVEHPSLLQTLERHLAVLVRQKDALKASQNLESNR